MRRNELKKLLDSSQSSQIKKALLFIYDNLGQSQKKEIDPALTALLADREEPLASLIEQAETFCRKAEQGAYARAAWQKEAQTIYVNLYKANTEETVEPMTLFFRTMTSGLFFPLFMDASDPFAALKTSQAAMFDEIVFRILDGGKTRSRMNRVLDLYCTARTKEKETFVYFAASVVNDLKTMAAKDIMRELIDQRKGEEENERLAFLHLLLDHALDEAEEKITDLSQETIPDLLYRLALIDQNDLWCLVYEHARGKRQLVLSAHMQATYEQLKKR